MTRLAVFAALAAAFAGSFAEATSKCNCDGNTCNAAYLDTVSTQNSTLYDCATTAVSSQIPSDAVVSPTDPTKVAANSVTALLATLNLAESKPAGLVAGAKLFLVNYQPFALVAINNYTSVFIEGYSAQGGHALNCTVGKSLVAPAQKTSDLCNSTGADLVVDETTFQELYDTVQDYFLFGFAVNMYTLLAKCFVPDCANLVGYLCNNPTSTFNPPSGVPSDLNTETLVTAAASLGTLARNAELDLMVKYQAGASNPYDVAVGFMANAPALDGTNHSVASTFAASGNLTIPCGAAVAIIKGNKPPTASASARGASLVAAAVALTAAVFAL